MLILFLVKITPDITTVSLTINKGELVHFQIICYFTMDDNKFLPKLSQNLLEILNDDEYYDITIEVGNDPYIKVFRSHMVILYYRSPYLRKLLSTSTIKKNDGALSHIKLPNILPEIFQIILR